MGYAKGSSRLQLRVTEILGRQVQRSAASGIPSNEGEVPALTHYAAADAFGRDPFRTAGWLFHRRCIQKYCSGWRRIRRSIAAV